MNGPAACTMVTDSGAIKASPGLLFGVVLTASGAAQISVKNGGAAGTEFLGLRLAAAGSVVFAPPVPIAFGKSLYVTVDAGAVEVSVVYV